MQDSLMTVTLVQNAARSPKMVPSHRFAATQRRVALFRCDPSAFRIQRRWTHSTPERNGALSSRLPRDLDGIDLVAAWLAIRSAQAASIREVPRCLTSPKSRMPNAFHFRPTSFHLESRYPPRRLLKVHGYVSLEPPRPGAYRPAVRLLRSASNFSRKVPRLRGPSGSSRERGRSNPG